MAVDMKTLAALPEQERGDEMTRYWTVMDQAKYNYARSCAAHAVALLRELFPGAASAEITVGHDGVDISVRVDTVIDGAGRTLYDVEDDELGERETDLIPAEDYLATAVKAPTAASRRPPARLLPCD